MARETALRIDDCLADTFPGGPAGGQETDGLPGRKVGTIRFQEALRLREKELGRRHPEVAKLLSNLGVFYAVRGEMPRAEGLF
ncbi:MAG TPA: tetratricopeptide repeat protein, partial [Thermoanaerobaculia bacterium]